MSIIEDLTQDLCSRGSIEITISYEMMHQMQREYRALISELAGYNSMMADRHRLLEENWVLKEKLRPIEGSK